MSSKEFNVVAILYPKKGKVDEVIGLLQGVSEYVKAKEPFVLKYEINRSLRPNKDGTEEIIMMERHKDQQGLKAHGSSEPFTAFQKTLAERDLLRAPTTLKMVSQHGGFASRL
ncbi:uncharacterized protein CLAFUR5_07760 [Fulvia fulva]|uniref:ABM domain-containing protein n=1 Tax=Passalora fulva TaxID=5499 RepID=A0A9Q8P6E0_PASFU|nr:uncharacterized protein CLAFUR5_07760 [Fulvia fulva]KAK4629806.1 hypothetical protein CLAFUR0_07637 [Fulvia fulva]UJO14732.1 hypothetical protein CLAFUR5_07760 [Fulvia fulva]